MAGNKWVSSILLTVLISSLSISHALAEPAKWTKKMQSLNRLLPELMTEVSSDARFNSPKNKAKIEKLAKDLATLSHGLGDKKSDRPDQDPSIDLLSKLFSSESQRAYDELKRGNRSYARSILKTIPGYCIGCHTRTNSGPQFLNAQINPTTNSLNTLEKAEFYAATRQYDRAMDEYRKIISDSLAPTRNPMDWEKAIRFSLAIAVRVKKDTSLSKEIVSRILGAKGGPYYLKQDAIQWEKSIQNWEKEVPNKALTEEGFRSEAIRLLARAHQLQKFPMDRSADIEYLRASAAVHDLLQFDPRSKIASEAFLLAGISYEVLRPFNLGELHEMYYEACVRREPHSPTAEVCFKRYEQSIWNGYTGSGGTQIPNDMKQKLKLLEELAHPVEAKPQ